VEVVVVGEREGKLKVIRDVAVEREGFVLA